MERAGAAGRGVCSPRTHPAVLRELARGTLHRGGIAKVSCHGWQADKARLSAERSSQVLGPGQEIVSVLHSRRALKGEKEEGEEWKRQRML